MRNEKQDYIPRNDATFNQFFRSITQYVAAKTSGPTPEWAHIPQSECITFHQAYSDWYRVYVLNFRPYSLHIIREKNRIRRIAESSLQNYVNRFLQFEPVTQQDRDKMGIPNRDMPPIHSSEVSDLVESQLRLRTVREVLVDFWAKGASSKAKPHGYDGAVLAWGVLDSPPLQPEDLPHNTLASHSPHSIAFDEAVRGKTLYAALAWQNQRGFIGRWSGIQSTVIP